MQGEPLFMSRLNSILNLPFQLMKDVFYIQKNFKAWRPRTEIIIFSLVETMIKPKKSLSEHPKYWGGESVQLLEAISHLT